MTSGELESWWERSDWAMGMAGKVLDCATDAFLAGELDIEDAAVATNLSTAWTDLATAWAEREEIDLGDDEMEPVPVKVTKK